MNEAGETPSNTESKAVAELAKAAARWEPWANLTLALLALLLIGDAILQPVASSVRSDGWYTLNQALVHVRDNIIIALPGYSLMWALWEARAYLNELKKPDLLKHSTQKAVTRIGFSLLVAGILAVASKPLLSLIYGKAAGPVELAWLALCGVGFLTIMIGTTMKLVIDVALELKRENDQFV